VPVGLFIFASQRTEALTAGIHKRIKVGERGSSQLRYSQVISIMKIENFLTPRIFYKDIEDYLFPQLFVAENFVE
jgi:hypothetical protein